MRTVLQPRGWFIRRRTCVQAEFPSSYPNVFASRPLRSTVVTRFFATMSRSDSRTGPLLGLCLPPRRWMAPPHRVSQVPRLIGPRALSPTTPEGPAAAFALYLTASIRLHPRGRTGHLQVPLTRPNRVHLRYGSRVRLARLRRTNCFVSRSLGYLSNGQLQGKLLSAYKISQAYPGAPPEGRLTMPHTYTAILVHAVFSTKQRKPYLTPEIKAELFPYLAGSLRPMRAKSVIVNGPRDHVHLLFSLPPALSLSDAMERLKANSSKWAHERWQRFFAWQEGVCCLQRQPVEPGRSEELHHPPGGAPSQNDVPGRGAGAAQEAWDQI
jgi:REP element-mobilizing transposase RayT